MAYQVCSPGGNPTHMVFHGVQWTDVGIVDAFNQGMYVICRKDRKMVFYLTQKETGYPIWTLDDKRLVDPIAVSKANRGPIITVADYGGQQIVNYRNGWLTDQRTDPNIIYFVLDSEGHNVSYVCSGTLSFPGYPFMVNTANNN
eukprot:Phypoly_transcript_22662.p1 GENE.Phypoly_transcript_22662~~Phypoly_transcript_22662.p1  ORF type:complete len:144 (+),score=14.18 Phypoly_transcript_22662:86-517(+)